MKYPIREEDIAVIGMTGRFPGANNIDQLWQNLCAAKESISFFNEQELQEAGIDKTTFQQANYVKAKGILQDVEYFDPEFFGLSALEAKLLDPQQRLFLLCAWEAFENAGYNPKQLEERVGVFASTAMSHYLLKNILANKELLANLDEYQLLLSNDKDFLATRISYLLNLRGPSINIQTGCSSSLACVHYACQSLLNGECELALAGGVSITLPQQQGYLYKKEMIGSPDGHCYAFDERAQGTVKSNGIGIVLLKPLQEAINDKDHIYAVIRGSAINNDGANKVGYTAPSVTQQARVIKEALAVAEVSTKDIHYIETHGTGTILGDPIEIAALKQAFNQHEVEKPYCALTSLKTNLGHLDVAAGVTSLIKASLAVYHGKIPASLNFANLNPKINLAGSPFYINKEIKDWLPVDGLRRAGISAFGVGGTNVHVILQQPPKNHPAKISSEKQLLLFSAKSKYSLQKNIENIQHFLQSSEQADLADVAYTLQTGRQAMPYRASMAIKDKSDFEVEMAALNLSNIIAVDKSPNVVFMFPGQGMQYPGMAADLYEANPVFKQALDNCLSALQPYLNINLKELILQENRNCKTAYEILKRTENAQPALFAVEYALACCFKEYGVQPQALVGHSIGEYVAAVFAGIFSLEDAAMLISKRGQLMQKLPAGNMLAVFENKQALIDLMPSTLDIALENAPQLTIVAGTTEQITLFAAQLEQKNIKNQLLPTSHAFHSRMLDPILAEFADLVSKTTRRAPIIRIASNYTGEWLTAAGACSVDYWVKQMRHTVKFASCVNKVQSELAPVFVEVGPGRTLQNLVLQQGIKNVINTIATQYEDSNNLSTFYRALSYLWDRGVNFKPVTKENRIPLPTYAWQLQRYWFDPPHQNPISHPEIKVCLDATPVSQDTIEDSIKSAWHAVLGAAPATIDDNFFTMGGNSLTAIQLIDRLPADVKTKINVVHLYQYPKYGAFIELVSSLNQRAAATANDNFDYEQTLFSEGVEI
jgi:acyl transferase domain-containing protein